MIRPAVSKEVPGILTINREHSYEVGRVNTASEKLDSETGNDVLIELDWWCSCREPEDAIVTTLKDTSEGMTA